ncbi:helix-turn-helix domain-containing protein [Affinibrenneria salicis]|uniref:helix-turn-helix domain-containing protein n=1 Tax=Affinibrenneria salicis TaxID=2590031 RepID=UPI001CC3384B|nr:helix-turn-helix domain-containing protein [Affinibrenneria salicis]
MHNQTDAITRLTDFVRQDNRPDGARHIAEEGAALFSFVTHSKERIADVVLRQPSLVVILEGAKQLVTMGRNMTFPAHTALALPAGWRGDVVNAPDARSGVYRAIFIRFPQRLITHTFRAHPEWQATPYTHRLSVPLDTPLIQAVHHAAEGITDPALPATLIEHRVMEVLLILDMKKALPLRPVNRSASITETVRLLFRWHPEQNWTLDALAAELGMSNATLRRKLMREGAGIRVLLTEERMSQAMIMLKDEGMAMHDVALAAGYRSVRRFRQQLQRYLDSSPLK